MKKEFYDMRFRALVLFFIMLTLFLLIAPLQNYAVESLKNLERSLNQLYEKFVGPGYSQMLANWSFYMYSQWFGKNFGQLVPIIAIVLAFPLFSRETENGTMEFLLARQSRLRVFINKTVSGIVALFSSLLLLSMLPTLYSFIVGKDFINDGVPMFTISVLTGGTLWFSATLFFSVLFNDQVKPILASLGVLALTTVLGLLKSLGFLNTYRYILGINIFNYGEVDIPYTVALIVVSIVLLFSGYLAFKNKEI